MPLYDVGRGAGGEGCAEVGEGLGGCYVEVVHGGEIEDDGAEGREVVVVFGGVLWWGVAPEMGLGKWELVS